MLKPGDYGFAARCVGIDGMDTGMAHVVSVETYTVEAIQDGKPICHPYKGSPNFAMELEPFNEAKAEAYASTKDYHDKATKQINDGYDELFCGEPHDFNLLTNYVNPEWAIGDIAYVVKIRKAWWSYLDVFKGKVIGVAWYIDPDDGKPGWRYTVYYKHLATKLDIEYGAKEGDLIEEADVLLPSDLYRTATEASHALSVLAREVHADYARAYEYLNNLTEADAIAAAEKEKEEDDKTE